MDAAEHRNWEKFTGSIAHILPDFIGLIFFFFGAYFAFTLVFWVDSPWVDLVFMAVLIATTFIRLIQITSKFIFSPANGLLRVVPMQDRTAQISHRLLVWTFGYIIAGLMFAVVARRLGAELETVRLLQLIIATLLIILTAAGILKYRAQIQDNIIAAGASDDQTPSWARKSKKAVPLS